MVVLGLLALTAVPAEAAREEGRIQVRQEEGEQLLLYPVGQKSGSDFVLGKLYGGGLVRGADIHRPELARWLAEEAQGGLQPVSKDGYHWFADLTEGLYLLTQENAGEDGFAPILVSMPCNGAWQVAVFPRAGTVYTEPPRTGQHPAPILGAMGIVVFGILLGMCMDRIKRK